jgi:hypothetical protein
VERSYALQDRRQVGVDADRAARRRAGGDR